MEPTNPIIELGQRFLDSSLRGVKIEGIAELLQDTFHQAKMPIQVAVRRNIIYLIRQDEGS